MILGIAVLLFGIGASWPFPTLSTELEMLFGIVAFLGGLIRLVIKMRSR